MYNDNLKQAATIEHMHSLGISIIKYGRVRAALHRQYLNTDIEINMLCGLIQ